MGTIKDIKRKYEVKLMQTPGVEGVGIGDKDGQECIVVYASKKIDKKKIPTLLDGYRVKIEFTGQFQAF